MAEPPRRPRTLNDARTEAEAAFKKTTTKVPDAARESRPSRGEGTGLAADRPGRAGVFPGGRSRLAGPHQRGAAKGRGQIDRQMRQMIFTALLAAQVATSAAADSVPFSCAVSPDQDSAVITITNALQNDATCIVTCTFSTVRGGINPQITCAKPVPAGNQVEMCRLPSGGDKMVRSIEGHAECTVIN